MIRQIHKAGFHLCFQGVALAVFVHELRGKADLLGLTAYAVLVGVVIIGAALDEGILAQGAVCVVIVQLAVDALQTGAQVAVVKVVGLAVVLGLAVDSLAVLIILDVIEVIADQLSLAVQIAERIGIDRVLLDLVPIGRVGNGIKQSAPRAAVLKSCVNVKSSGFPRSYGSARFFLL